MAARLTLFAGLGLLFSLGGCESAPANAGGSSAVRSPADPAWVQLSRIPNERASHPIYTVTVGEDGRVMFQGSEGVGWPRSYIKTIPRTQAAAIFAQIEIVNFWSRDRRYDIQRENVGGDSRIVGRASPDAPWDVITAHRVGRTHQIEGLFFAPSELIDLQRQIEQTVGLAEWLSGRPAAAP